MAALLAFVGCSDDFDPQTPGRLDSDGTLHLSFGVSPMKKGLTRSSDQIGAVTMYVYDAGGTELQVSPVIMSGNLTGTVMLNSSVIEEGSSARFYFVANPTDMEGNGNSLGGLKGATFTEWENAAGQLTMSSKEVNIDNAQSNTVALYHNAAKITVRNAVEDTKSKIGYKAGSEVYPFVPQGTAEKSLVLAGGLNATDATEGLGSHSSTNLPTELSTEEQYVHPTDNSSAGNANKAWIIVEAQYGDENYYYRLDFQEKKEKTPATTPATYEIKAIDVRPNHHYQFLIKSIKGPGYKTIEEAAANPTPMLDYVIHDHAPVIYNMISDGSRELGVAKEKTRNETNPGTEIFYVKLFSPTASEMEEITKSSNWSSIFGIDVDWLKVTGVKEFTSDDLGEGETMDDYYGDSGVGVDNEGNPDTNSRGKIFKVTLQFSNTNNPGTLSTSINVNWHGLSRSVDIKWIRDFNTDNLFDPVEKVQLKIYAKGNENWNENGHELYNKDYFGDFLKNGVQGVKLDDNNGQQRDNGLHFPMPYGNDNNNKWTYIYKVTLNSNLGGGGDFTWDVTASGISGLKIKIPSGSAKNKNDREFYITRSSSADDFRYEKGKLILTITTTDGEVKYDNVALYHTGFFHWDNTNSGDNSSDNSSASNDKNYISTASGTTQHPNKYNYYEVVKVGEGDNAEYWLDRNMGASSAQSHIEGGMENPTAQGYYMAAGYYWKYNSPIIFKNSVPPGYEVPSVEQWNKLKNASNFNIEQVGSYYYPTLRVGDKEVYFPKGRYYNGSVKQGENRAGYYWTRDAATGTEKDETGNWLKCMQFAGTSSSYINGCTMGRDDVSAYYMSLRAVAKSNSDVNHPKKFFFLVKGATHIYLYKGEGKDRVAAFTWPGKAIGNYSTSNKTYSFSYETTTSQPEELMVIFNFVDDKGRVYTMSKNVFNDTEDHYSINPENARGWNVIGSEQGEDFTAYTDCGVTISSPLDSDNKSINGTLWTCNSGFVVPDPPKPPFSFRLVWPTGKGGQIKIKDIETDTWITSPGDTFVNNSGTGWYNNNNYDNNGAYYFDGNAPETSRDHKVKIYVTNGSTTWVTKYELKITSDWNPKMLYDTDFQTEGGGGGSDEFTYALKGEIIGGSGNWTVQNMTSNSDDTWSCTMKFNSGGFGIQKLKNGSQVDWINASGESQIGSTGGTFETKSNGTNFNLQTAGTYTITYNPDTDKLIVTNSGSQTSKYVIYFQTNGSASGWNPPYAYCFTGKTINNGDWPGQAMEKVKDNVWKLETDREYEYVIFSNYGASQLKDAKFRPGYIVYGDNPTYEPSDKYTP